MRTAGCHCRGTSGVLGVYGRSGKRALQAVSKVSDRHNGGFRPGATPARAALLSARAPAPLRRSPPISRDQQETDPNAPGFALRARKESPRGVKGGRGAGKIVAFTGVFQAFFAGRLLTTEAFGDDMPLRDAKPRMGRRCKARPVRVHYQIARIRTATYPQ